MSAARPKPAYCVSIEKSPSGVSRLPPFLPPDEIRIDALFLRKVFDRAKRLGYSGKRDVLHVDIFRRLLQRLTDALEADEPIWKQDCFKLAFQSTEVRWEEVRRGIFEDEGYGGLPRVEITPMERCSLVLQGDGGSIAGLAVQNVVFAAIIVSILDIFDVTDKFIGWGDTLRTICMWIYSVEYLAKLACSPFCRFGVSPDTQWLLDQTVPMPDTSEKTNHAGLLPPDRPTRWQGLVAFVMMPMNLIDLMAVMPFWVKLVLSMTGQEHNKSLGFLRAFRVLRLFRVARLGKFNSTMTVLGDTARRSASAFAVMITWITLMSIIIGPILKQLEEGNNPKDETGEPMPWPFDTVPMAVWWVSGRLCNMHYSLPEKNEKPKSNWSAPLVILIGLFKSPVLLAAVGQLKAAFKAAQDEQNIHEKLEQQVTREQAVPLCAEWTRSSQSASAEVDILDEDDHLVGTCEFNLPIRETADQNVALTIPIRSEHLSHCCGPRPALELQVVWRPRPESSGQSPIGRLEIWPLEGMRFRGPPDEEWRCCLRVPIRPDSSEEAVEEWLSEPSDDSAPTPSWEGQSAVFEVDWSSLGDLSKDQGSSSNKDEKIRQFVQRNTYLLETMATFGMT